jgi:hypothetical protein
MSGRDSSALGRREFIQRAGTTGAAAGLVWSAPRINIAAPAAAGTPKPTHSSEPAPPVVEPSVIEPGAGEPTVEGATLRPEPPPSILALASTGADIATMAATGALSLGAGALLHHAGKRDRTSEVVDGELGEEAWQEGATSWEGP